MLHFSKLLLLAASMVVSVAAAPVAAPVLLALQAREPTNLYLPGIKFVGDPDE